MSSKKKDGEEAGRKEKRSSADREPAKACWTLAGAGKRRIVTRRERDGRRQTRREASTGRRGGQGGEEGTYRAGRENIQSVMRPGYRFTTGSLREHHFVSSCLLLFSCSLFFFMHLPCSPTSALSQPSILRLSSSACPFAYPRRPAMGHGCPFPFLRGYQSYLQSVFTPFTPDPKLDRPFVKTATRPMRWIRQWPAHYRDAFTKRSRVNAIRLDSC